MSNVMNKTKSNTPHWHKSIYRAVEVKDRMVRDRDERLKPLIYRLRIKEGKTFKEIAEVLNKRGLPTSAIPHSPDTKWTDTIVGKHVKRMELDKTAGASLRWLWCVYWKEFVQVLGVLVLMALAMVAVVY